MIKQFLILALFLVTFHSAQAASIGPAHTDYEPIAAGVSAQVLGPVGGAGDVIERLIITVDTSASGTVSLTDGSSTIRPITAANTPIGVYSVILGARSVSGAWKVTTGAGATAIAVGRFK